MLKMEDIPEVDRPAYIAAADRYAAALHALQTGIATCMTAAGVPNVPMPPPARALEPKHMRVGIDSAITSASSVAALLVRKGVLTALEVMEALATDTEADVATYERDLAEFYGKPITLA